MNAHIVKNTECWTLLSEQEKGNSWWLCWFVRSVLGKSGKLRRNEPIMIEYTLKMNSSQTRTCLKAIELLMRLKLNQYEEIPFAIMNLGGEDFCEIRDEALPWLKKAFAAMFKNLDKVGVSDSEWKDAEWYRLYNLYQAIRYQLHNAENPAGKGVDSYPPMQMTADEPIPECTYEKRSDNNGR